MRRLAFYFTLLWSCLSVAQPTSLQLESDWKSWSKVGSADLNWLFFDIYQSHLFTPSGDYRLSHDVTPHPLALSITYERDIEAKDLLSVTYDQWLKLGYSDEQALSWLETISPMFPDISEGDQLVYVSDGADGEIYWLRKNSYRWQLMGNVTDELTNDAFLSIWLSPKTEYPRLRRQLIGMVTQ
ncbi:chalcone isomerase family protein [Vibrio astriarenae]|uniref:chalcone isomerase family protein n=1 Tax=Vibrio astriarenae TaxID=1481923 RepID=UPI001EF7C432|nr:chalcone isomerase family protein [Vibrio astriarenae]